MKQKQRKARISPKDKLLFWKKQLQQATIRLKESNLGKSDHNLFNRNQKLTIEKLSLMNGATVHSLVS